MQAKGMFLSLRSLAVRMTWTPLAVFTSIWRKLLWEWANHGEKKRRPVLITSLEPAGPNLSLCSYESTNSILIKTILPFSTNKNPKYHTSLNKMPNNKEISLKWVWKGMAEKLYLLLNPIGNTNNGLLFSPSKITLIWLLVYSPLKGVFEQRLLLPMQTFLTYLSATFQTKS